MSFENSIQYISAAGAIDLNAKNVQLAAGSAYAVTLAAPTKPGQHKTIECVSGTQNVTLALTNVTGGSASTTATFNAAGEGIHLVSNSNSKWVVLKEFGGVTVA